LQKDAKKVENFKTGLDQKLVVKKVADICKQITSSQFFSLFSKNQTNFRLYALFLQKGQNFQNKLGTMTCTSIV
jgi:hypothetical protein